MSCYERLEQTTSGDFVEETFLATGHTGSPWSADLQHGGPVAALLTRAMDRCTPRDGTRLARVTVEFLGPVPIGEVRTCAQVERPGRRVELLASRLDARQAGGTWRQVAHARGWRLATEDTSDVHHHADHVVPLPRGGPQPVGQHPLPAALHTSAFVQALDWRYTPAARVPGTPTVAWMRLARPLVAGEQTTPLEQAVAIADVANGIGARLDPACFNFPNTELSVHLHERPRGSWFGLAAETSIGADGIGVSAATLHHENGPIGRVTQTVLVQRRHS